MTPQTDTLPPKPETEEVQDAQGGCLQQACSALVEALDDGQEVKMHRFWNPSEQKNEYLVRIFGDCYIEAERETLDHAINTAVAQYRLWKETDDE